jgi:hypothetical protein
MIKIITAIAWLGIALTHADAQTNFKTQTLEPFGGKIQMPEDWHYRERHGGSSYLWTLSRENPDDGPYVTGVKIQYLMGVEAGTGQSAEQFLRQFAEQQKTKFKVLNECEAEAQDFFTRICLQTLEPASHLGDDLEFRIQYSLFWGNELDIAIVMIQGTLADHWDQYQTTFATMQAFDFIDMSRFE